MQTNTEMLEEKRAQSPTWGVVKAVLISSIAKEN